MTPYTTPDPAPDPVPDPTPEPRPPRRRYLVLLLKMGAGAGGVLALVVLAAVIWGDRFINATILPRLETEIENTIDRPVDLGEVEGFSFWGVTLGKTLLPPTETDESTAVVDAVEVTVDVRSLIFQRSLRPKIIFIRPDVSLAQSEDGQWLEIGLPEPSDKEPFITLDIQTIEAQDATLTASIYEQIEPEVPDSESIDSEEIALREPLQATKTDALISFYGDESEQVDFELEGKVGTGSFDVQGKGNLEQRAVNASVRSQNFPITSFNLLLPETVGISEGTLNSNLTVKAALTEDDQLDESAVDLRGTVDLRAGEVKTTVLADPITDIRSRLKFKGQRVTIEDTGLQLGEIALVAFGEVDVEEGYDLTAQIPAVTIAQAQTLAELELPVEASGSFQITTQITGDVEAPQGRGRLASLQPLLVDKLGFETAVADFELASSEPLFEAIAEDSSNLPLQFTLTELRIVPQEGGLVTAEGTADLSDLENPSFQLTAQTDLPVDRFAQTFDIALPEEVTIGTLIAEIEAGGTLESPTAFAQWQLLESTFAGSGEVTVQDNIVALERTRLRVDEGTVTARGTVNIENFENPSFQLTAQTDLPVDRLAETFDIATPAETTIGTLIADVEASGTLESPVAFAQWQLLDSTFPGSGEVALRNNIATLDNTRLRVAEGTVTAEAIAFLEEGRWQATAATDRVPIEQFTTQAQGLLSANIDASGRFDELDLERIQARGTAEVANAEILLNEATGSLIERGTWTTAFEWQGDHIAVNSFTAPGIEADGTIGVDFNKSIPIGELALNVALSSFNLAPLNNFAPPTAQEYVQIAGLTSFDGRLTGTLEDPRVAGRARLENLAVNDLLFETLAGPVALSLSDGGSVDLRGQQDRLQLVANAQPWPVSFEVRNQAFVARGYGGEGRQLYAEVVDLSLETLNLRAPAGSPLRSSFGELEGLLNANIEADLADFSSPIVEGDLTVAQPAIAPIDAEQITAAFQYANNTAVLEQGELLLDDSRYLLTATASLAPEIQYEGELTVAKGQIEDLVEIVESLDLNAFGVGEPDVALGTAADLPVQPVGLPAGSFLERLETFVAFVDQLPEETPETGTFVRPPLEDLAGEFTGAIQVAGRSLSIADLTADFNLQGSQWQWGPYTPPNQFLISGDIQQQTLSLDTVDIDAGETTIDLTGVANLDRLNGQLSVNNLPVELAGVIYPLPINVEGDLNVATTFAGSLSNPVVNGEATVVGTQIGEYPLDRAGATFSYRDARLAWAGEAALRPTDAPLKTAGSVLYALPFMSIQPPVEQIQATALVPGDSFDFINTVTEDRVRWEGGTGEVVVNVGGTLSEPLVAGRASFREGAIASTLLADPLTNINGDIRFDLTQVNIEQLQANMQDGQLLVAGALPLLPSGQSILAQDTALTSALPVSNNSGLVISLDALPVDYSGLLQAVLQGQVLVLGSVLAPNIGGNIEIDDGQIQANELLGQAGAISLPTEEEIEEISPYRVEYLGLDVTEIGEDEKPEGFLDDVRLENFGLTFGDRLAIIGSPFYNLSALGSLAVNGPLSAPQPEGTIELKSGWINLFSTQFRLDRNAANTATFTPGSGLDPFVDVVLTARVRDRDITPAPPAPGGFISAETEINPNVTTIGEVEYIKVQAVAQGPASQLTDKSTNSLTLTSNSARSQRELLAILGSGAFSDLTTASLTQLTGFLGAGSLANFGSNVAGTLGLKSFSVFPTTDTSTESSVGIGLGVEATAGIGRRLEVSALEILNSSTPPQLGLQYRFTDSLELRGSSNLDESEFSLEYEIDF